MSIVKSRNGKVYINANGEVLNAPSGGGITNVTWNQCPEAVRNYIDEVTYNPNDYSTSAIANYAPSTGLTTNTKPIGKTIDGVTYYNEAPQSKTPFASNNAAGTLKPLDQIRWINTKTSNVRDLGGWQCDGGTIKYGKLFRGGEAPKTTPNIEYDANIFLNELNIQSEMDLRGIDSHDTQSAFDSSIEYFRFDEASPWYTIVGNTDIWKKILRVIFTNVKYRRPIYFHCAAGADRTGTLACIIEAILGVSQSDIDKDYELTSFTGSFRRRCDDPPGGNTSWRGLIGELKSIEIPYGTPDTLMWHTIYFIASLGFTQDEINEFRKELVNGTPSEIELDLGEYQVTKSTEHIAYSNQDDTAIRYQPYETDVYAYAGYVISNVEVTMNGEKLNVFTGRETTLYKIITNNLSHCVTDNDVVRVGNNESYSARITPYAGYILDGAEVSITMGGIEMSETYYSNGVISIPNVTGDIVINITAIKQGEIGYTNIVSQALNEDGSAVYNNGLGYKNNTRLRSTWGQEEELKGATSTGYIPVHNDDVIRFKGILWNSDEVAADYNGKCYIVIGEGLPSEGATTFIAPKNSDTTLIKDEYGSYMYTYKSSTHPDMYIRICGVGMGEALIVTKNEEIK